MADPTVIQCSSACTVQVQLEFITPLANLSADDGAQIAVAIVAVWVVGWTFRQLTRLVLDRVHGSSGVDDD